MNASSYTLKRIALFFMVLDHIGVFLFPSIEYFRWVGRFSYPIFLFVFVNSIDYTSNKKMFVTRIWLFGAGISILEYVIRVCTDSEVYVDNNIFGTYFALFLCISIIEWCRKEQRILPVLLYLIWQALNVYLIMYPFDRFDRLWAVMTGNLFFNEGSFFAILLGIVLYYTKGSKKKMGICFSLVIFMDGFMFLAQIPLKICVWLEYFHLYRISEVCDTLFAIFGYDFLFANYSYEWLAVGALPFLLSYNGEKGSGNKYFFYWFYPLHIFLLAFLGNYISYGYV